MLSYTTTFCILICLQATWSYPIDTITNIKTYGSRSLLLKSPNTQLSNNNEETLSKVMENLKTGFTSLSAPIVRLGLSTEPQLLSNSLKTGNRASINILKAKRDVFGKVAVGSSKAAGGGVVLVSSIVGGKMRVIRSVLGVLGTLIEAVSKLSLNIPSQIRDAAVVGNDIVGNITSDTLQGLGDGMKFVGTGVNIIADCISNLINTIGNALFQNVVGVQQTFNDMMKSGLMKFQSGNIPINSQLNHYIALNAYMKAVIGMEAIIGKLINSLATKGSLDLNDAEKAAGNLTIQLAADPDAVNIPALTAAADLTAALAATDPDAVDKHKDGADKTADLEATSPESTINSALSDAEKITLALASVVTVPSGNNLPASENPEKTNKEEVSATVNDKPDDITMENANSADENQPASTDAADIIVLGATNSESTINSALSDAEKITLALASLVTVPSNNNLPASENPEKTNNEGFTATVTEKPNEVTMENANDASEKQSGLPDAADPIVLGATNPESTINSVLSDAEKMTLALASLVTVPSDNNQQASAYPEENANEALADANTEKTDSVELETVDVTEDLAITKPEGSVSSALLNAEGIITALAAMDPLYSS